MDRELIARYREIEPCEQLLADHLYETAQLAELFGKNFGFNALIKLAGLLHDVGKGTKEWQEYLQDHMKGHVQKKLDHATQGAKLLAERAGDSRLALTAIQAAMMYHHGSGLPDMIGLDGISDFEIRLAKRMKPEELSEIKDHLSEKVKLGVENCLQSSDWKGDGRTILFEVCKNGCGTKKKLCFNMGLHLRNFSSCLIDADRTDSIVFEKGEDLPLLESVPHWDDLISRLEEKLRSFPDQGELSRIRAELSERCARLGRGEKGVYTCSAVTGAGKTLASLRFALEQAKKFDMEHIFMIAPYTSIIDQNADIIRSILEDESTRGRIVLECHASLTSEKKADLGGSEEEYERFESAWNAPVVITTMVQFLETLFGSGTKSIRRMHRLANSVLIFDEVQTLPIKSTYLFNWALDYLVKCCSCSTMLCTATQPCLDKIKDSQYALRFDDEAVEDVVAHFSALKRVQFVDKTDGGQRKTSAHEICAYITEQMKTCGSFLAVVNTKPQAKALFELLRESGCADFIYHLSTNMCPAHRREKIDEIREKLNRSERVICVSTRLIEAGVDISFGGALRYLAGLDSIIQTAGRCNRNGELMDEDGNQSYGTVAIFAVEDESLGSMEELKLAQRSMERILWELKNDSGHCNLIQPDVIQAYFNYYYQGFSSSQLKFSVKGKDTTILDMLSDNPVAVAEYQRIRDHQNVKLPLYKQAFRTAWENFEVIADATTGVISTYESNDLAGRFCALEKREEGYGEKLRALLREAQQYSVNLYANQFSKLIKEEVIYELQPGSGIYALHDGFYDQDLGFTSQISGDSFSVLAY